MDPTQELAQFEPDPEGVGSLEPAATSAALEDDPQWIVWPDAAGEAAWAAAELTHITTAWWV
ncbi:MAG: hypothetical protein E6J60_01670 [Deltaproteobacteria bacterium]|jgi:hypothetical protein|nr:MAG: hypothetical protein E6J60_01670 [Deltaproteobacteria bacterium]